MLLGGFAVALRFVPYSDDHGRLHTGWTLVMVAFGVIVVAASAYLVYVLEILKVKRLDTLRMKRAGATESEIDARVQERLETGEFEAVEPGTEEFESAAERP